MATLRPTVPGDVPGILDLIAEIFSEYGCVLDAQREDTHLLNPGPHFRERGGDFWVVEQGGRIVATVALVLHEDAGEIRCLYVHRDLRRQGWGRRLSQMTMKLAWQAGKRRMILWSDTRFVEAHRLYQALGFTRCGQRDLHDSNHTVEHGFETELRHP
jgi:N-acetylglutamate synthase-like GNAT family acetyltransferase